jgi:hypothetical protein
MVSVAAVKKIALQFEEVIELPHFERTSFRVNKKIFATLDEKSNLLCAMLTPEDQSVFILAEASAVYPVPNKWGKQGATYVDLKKVPAILVKEILSAAYCGKAPKRLAGKYKTI